MSTIAAATHLVARECLEAVVEKEPDYGLAMSYLGLIYTHEITFGFNTLANSSLEKGLEFAEEGARLDPTNADTHIYLAINLLLNNDPNRAVREAEEALRLFPNGAMILGSAAFVQTNTGGYDRGKELMDWLGTLNPDYPLWMEWNYAKIHLARHEYLEAVTWLEPSGTDWWYWTKAFIAGAQCAHGNIERGQSSLQAALEINPDLAGVYWREMHMWLKADGLYPLMGNVGAGLEACGWDVPTDPGPEAFAPTQ